MLKSIKGLCGWHRKDYSVIYKFWKQRIVKQDESDGDPKFIVTIKLEEKLTNYWKSNKKQTWKWKGVWKAHNTIIKCVLVHFGFH
jgi:hypothetical protein